MSMRIHLKMSMKIYPKRGLLQKCLQKFAPKNIWNRLYPPRFYMLSTPKVKQLIFCTATDVTRPR